MLTEQPKVCSTTNEWDAKRICWGKMLWSFIFVIFLPSLICVATSAQTCTHFFLDVDNQIIMKPHYHITKTCKTSSSEEFIFRETGTRKKVQWKRYYHVWVFRVHCTVMSTDKTRTQASLQSERPYRVSLLQSMCSVLEEYDFHGGSVHLSMSHAGAEEGVRTTHWETWCIHSKQLFLVYTKWLLKLIGLYPLIMISTYSLD